MSRYDDSRSRGRSSHHRDRSPGYSGGPYPVSYEESRQQQLANTGGLALDDEGAPLKQLTYEPQTPPYPSRPSSSLQVPESHSRPRSLPSDEYRRSSRGRRKERRHRRDDGHDDDYYSSDGHDDDYSGDGRAQTPIDKARNFVDSTFTNSTAGLGIGVLGALVGGLAAREAVDAATSKGKGKSNGHHHRHDSQEHKRNQLIGTVVGAAVGALGANAVEKRLEVRREKGRIEQEKWERKFRPGSRDAVDRREVVPRSRSSSGNGSGWKRDWDPWDERERERDRDRDRDWDRPRSRGVEREVDPEARSWKNVEDWVYDERNDSRPKSSGHRIAEGEYRY